MDFLGHHVAPWTMNAASATLLMLAAWSMLIIARRADATPAAFGSRTAYALAGALALLSLDDGAELHELLGRWLYEEYGIEAPGPINHVDDLFVLAYLGVLGFAGALALPSLRRRPALLAWLAVAAAIFVVSVGVDALAPIGHRWYWTEESIELLAFAMAAYALAREAAIDVPLLGALRPVRDPAPRERPGLA